MQPRSTDGCWEEGGRWEGGRKVQVFEVMRLGRRTATQATLSTGSQATADDEVESGKVRAFCQAPPATDQSAGRSR